MINDKFIPWLYLSTKTNISKKKIYALYKHFKSGEAIVKAGYDELKAVDVLNDAQLQDILNYNPEAVGALVADIEKNELSLISPECEAYPKGFGYLPDPPVILYVKGRVINLNDYLCIASVGTRDVSEYGKRYTYSIVQGIAREGAIIVSGMAQGVDSISHKAAIDAHMPTVAFVGNGADVIYPAMNRALYKEILKTGMVVSEYVPGTRARSYQFPERNRLVAAAAEGLFLSEAAIKSGSAITCRQSLSLGKDLFALPGNADSPGAKLPISLLKEGAIPVDSGEDIIGYYKSRYEGKLELGKSLSTLSNLDKASETEPLSHTGSGMGNTPTSDKDKILEALRDKPGSIDELFAVCGIGLDELGVLLLMLEMEMKIKEDNGKFILID